MKKFDEETLGEKTVVELRELCKKYGISGMSKIRKDEIIEAILDYYESEESEEDSYESDNSVKATSNNSKLPHINAGIRSYLRPDNSYHTLISISCGAASSNYPVVGRTVGFVKATYREILNIDTAASSVVNGDTVGDSYVLKSGDTLEFVRNAGTKG